MARPKAKVEAERIAFRFTKDEADKLRYWAEKNGQSMNEYISDALARQIAWENQDYPIPTLEQARLNQLIDEMRALTTQNQNLEHVVVTGFESLLGLTRGENYLLDDEDGELG